MSIEQLMSEEKYSFGPQAKGSHYTIRTFAPGKKVSLLIRNQTIPMEKQEDGFWETDVGIDFAGSSYGFLVNGHGPFPDPASRFLPEGMGGLSQLLDTDKYEWKSVNWKGLPLEDYIIDEVHVGTFTEQGTFSSMEERLEHLSEIGITAVEIMPVSQFYGSRNWGYDGVYIYSPHYGYGTPRELMHLVDSIHSHGMCAILDVVYNHSGPVGNYLEEFAPYYNHGYRTPWGHCFNLDGEYSDQIREYILQNAVYWLSEFRFDALRLDAVHGIIDHSPVHILKEMSLRIQDLRKETGRNINLIAESDRNDRMLTKDRSSCGLGIDGQWNDDFHHVLHTAFTGERKGYYMDYEGEDEVKKVMESGFLYQGNYSRYLKRKRGSVWDNPNFKLIVCSQNHDQIGNRAMGERLITLAGREKAKLAALLTILSPFTPLLFMGEEIGEESPFLFFIQTDDQEFARMVYEGRREEFSRFNWSDDTPDPSALETFQKSRVKWENMSNPKSEGFMNLYRHLISTRKSFVNSYRNLMSCEMDTDGVLKMRYGDKILILASFSQRPNDVQIDERIWRAELDTSWKVYAGNKEQSEISGGIYRLEPFSGAVFIRR